MSEKTISLILGFLYNKQNKIFGKIQTSRHDGPISHACITFNYQGNDVEICVYNDNFIRIMVNGEPWEICDGIRSVRDSIYKIDYHNYGYRYCL